ncbi:MAG TPA: VOC family protein [Roseiflexaceae bacterium]|nr:VOC family protein [Roseiflexaceae bacterium]
MAATPSLDFVVFYVSEPAKSLAYFTDVLGFKHIPEEDTPGFHFLTGDGGISFGLVQANEQTPAPGAIVLYLKTDDLAGRRDIITSKGVEATPIEPRPFGSIFSVHTPDGYPLTLFEPPAPAS